MSEQSEKRTLEKATIWALIGVLATVLIGVPGIYYAIHEKQPHISYELVGDSKVLDVHQPVKELEIRYRGEDIYALKKNLRVLTLTVRNDGEVHIKQADFDQTMPWGISIKGGQIVDVPKVVSFNSDYIRNNINPQVASNNLIIFQKIILERNKYFTIEIQLLNRVEEEPELHIVGKIAGIENPIINNNRKENAVPGLWTSVFYGTLSVQLVRLVVFIVGTIILIAIVVLLIIAGSTVERYYKNQSFRRRVNRFLEPLLVGKDQIEREYLRRLFIRTQGNIDILKDLKLLFSNPDNVSLFLRNINREYEHLATLTNTSPTAIAYRVAISRLPSLHGQGSLVYKQSPDGKGFILHTEFLPAIDELIAYMSRIEPPLKLRKLLGIHYQRSPVDEWLEPRFLKKLATTPAVEPRML
ncbi:MAG: hypothetical protein ABSH38_01260 [Verrucomicrobiota bacterium]|jgi:hypothetical protein